jgi:uncharacterized membrane protein YccC
MLKDRAFWLFIILLCLVIFICVAVAFVFRDTIQFAPADAINDGIDFVLGLLAMIVSFWVAEVYWKRKTEEEQSGRALDQLNYYLSSAATIVMQTSQALAEQFHEGQSEAAQRRDQEVLANLRRLGDVRSSIARTLHVSTLELGRCYRPRESAARLHAIVMPALERLSKHPQIRPLADEIASDLANVGNELQAIREYLRGGNDESHPPWGSDKK